MWPYGRHSKSTRQLSELGLKTHSSIQILSPHLEIYGVLHAGAVNAVDVDPPVHPHGVQAPPQSIQGDGTELSNTLQE